MDHVIYEVVPYDGAYRVGDACSDSFPSHDTARGAAARAAGEAWVAGEKTGVVNEHGAGGWRADVAGRPQTEMRVNP